MKERRFDQLGAVMASVKISSKRAGSTGVGRKSRVDLRAAANAEKSSGVITVSTYGMPGSAETERSGYRAAMHRATTNDGGSRN
jgi:hypothetical protein